jgi:hypothetical protein
VAAPDWPPGPAAAHYTRAQEGVGSPHQGHVVTSLNLNVCEKFEFQKLALNLSAYEIIKDVFLFPFPKLLDLI